MNIEYPPLVEQTVSYYQQPHHRNNQAKCYRQLVKRGIITTTGEPTTEALANGWVKDFYEAENLSFSEFVALYPIFSTYDHAVFKKIEGFWEIPITLQRNLLERLSKQLGDYDELIQIEAYLEER